MLRQLVGAGQALPLAPFGIRRHGHRGLHRLPLIGRDHRQQIAQPHQPGRGKLRSIELARRDQFGTQRCWMDHAGVQHPRQLDIAHPHSLARDLGANDRVHHRLANNGIIGHLLERRLARHHQPEKAGQRARNGDGEAQILPGHDIAIARLLAAARDHPIGHAHRRARHAKALRGQLQHRLAGIGRHLAHIAGSIVQQPESAAAIGGAVGIARDHRGDRLHRHREFLGHDLAIGGVDRALPEIAFAGAQVEGVVGVDLDPAGGLGRIERGATRRPCQLRRDAQCHHQRPASAEKTATAEPRAMDGDMVGGVVHHAAPPAISFAARCTPSRIAA